MKVKLSIVLMSHLSDIQIETFIPEKKNLVQDRLGFIKYLINRYSDTNVEIDAKAEWSEYMAKMDAEVKEIMDGFIAKGASSEAVSEFIEKNQLFRHG